MKPKQLIKDVVRDKWSKDVDVYIYHKESGPRTGQSFKEFKKVGDDEEIPEGDGYIIAIVPKDILGTTGEFINKSFRYEG